MFGTFDECRSHELPVVVVVIIVACRVGYGFTLSWALSTYTVPTHLRTVQLCPVLLTLIYIDNVLQLKAEWIIDAKFLLYAS